MITVTCLKTDVAIGGVSYPVLMAFLTAEELLRVAEVPNFDRAKKHSDIANSLRQQPLDEWQRPPEMDRVKRIADVFSDSGSPSLMANPVLVGNSTNASGNWKLTPKMVGTGVKAPVPDVFELELTETSPKPLWILDGQHRILGMSKSTQKSQKIPVVLLVDAAVYPSPFLAKMFTQVTTEAKPMKRLHGEWMSYAFGMADYQEPAWRNAMQASVELVSLAVVDGSQNELLNNIKFNPYEDAGDASFRTLRWDVRGWNEVLVKHYYGQSTTTPFLAPKALAENIIRFIRAVVELDGYRDSGSRLLHNNGSEHPMLFDQLLRTFLEFCAHTGAQKAQAEWKQFLSDDGRNFGACDWRLPWVVTSGSTSGTAFRPSKKALRLAMAWLFNEPHRLNTFPLAEILRGPGDVLLEGFARTSKGNKQTKKDVVRHKISGGNPKFNLSQDGIARRDVRFRTLEGSLASVVSVEWRGMQPTKRWSADDYIDLSSLGAAGSTVTLQVETYCYSSDSRQEITVTLLWS